MYKLFVFKKVEVWNKIDMLEKLPVSLESTKYAVVPISAALGTNFNKLEKVIFERLQEIQGKKRRAFKLKVSTFNKVEKQVMKLIFKKKVRQARRNESRPRRQFSLGLFLFGRGKCDFPRKYQKVRDGK